MKYSKQRESILNYLKGTKEHPTAEKIYADLKQELPNLSLATVYRNLGQLCEAGQVVRLAVGEKTDHYDADNSMHQHFVCSACGAVSDIYCKLPEELLKNAMEQGFLADSYKLYVYGKCAFCGK